MAASPTIASLLTFSFLIWSGRSLTADTVFTALALFSSLGFPLKALPKSISLLGDARAVMTRLTDMLHSAPRPAPPAPSALSSTAAVELAQAGLAWEDGVPRLQGVSLAVTGSRLVLVVGPVGAGKSLLLAAIAGDAQV